MESKPLDKISSLAYLGVDYQYRLVKCFIEDSSFYRDIQPLVTPNSFSEGILKKITNVMGNYLLETGKVVDYSSLGILLRQTCNTPYDLDEVNSILKKMEEDVACDKNLIEGEAVKFFKQQSGVKIANQILEAAENGVLDQQLEEYERKLHEVNALGDCDEAAYRMFDDIPGTLKPDYRSPIPTGIGKLDEFLVGGLGRGELGIVIGPSGFGKTTMSTAMTNYAAGFKCTDNFSRGYKVLQITFEDKKEQMRRKHLARFTEVEACQLSDLDKQEGIWQKINDCHETIEMLNDNILGLKYATGELTVAQLKAKIEKRIKKGFIPDVIMLDYFECLKLVRTNNIDKFEAEGIAAREIEAMAEYFNCAIWLFNQGTRESFKGEVVTMDQSGGSIKKVQIGHVVVSISKTAIEAKTDHATINIPKNRAGRTGCFRNAYFNNGTCVINTDDCVEFDDILDSVVADMANNANKSNGKAPDQPTEAQYNAAIIENYRKAHAQQQAGG